MDPDCVFCEIVSGELPAEHVYQDDRTIAIMDLNPATRGHLLVMPRVHVADVASASLEDWLAVATTSRRMARWVAGAFKAGGVDLVQANSSDQSMGAQTVFHLHVHVLPRYHDDRLGTWWSPQTTDPSEVAETARQLIDFGRSELIEPTD